MGGWDYERDLRSPFPPERTGKQELEWTCIAIQFHCGLARYFPSDLRLSILVARQCDRTARDGSRPDAICSVLVHVCGPVFREVGGVPSVDYSFSSSENCLVRAVEFVRIPSSFEAVRREGGNLNKLQSSDMAFLSLIRPHSPIQVR